MNQYTRRNEVERRMALKKVLRPAGTLLIDWCIRREIEGCIQEVYPPARWEVVCTITGHGWPMIPLLSNVVEAGASVLAYGGVDLWFGLREKKQ